MSATMFEPTIVAKATCPDCLSTVTEIDFETGVCEPCWYANACYKVCPTCEEPHA